MGRQVRSMDENTAARKGGGIECTIDSLFFFSLSVSYIKPDVPVSACAFIVSLKNSPAF